MNTAVFNALAPSRNQSAVSRRRSRSQPGELLALPSGNLAKGVAMLNGTTTDATETALSFLNSTVSEQRSTRFEVGYKQAMRYDIKALGVLKTLDVVNSGLTVTPFTTGTLKLAAGASAVDDYYNDMEITITAGTGVGEVRRVRDYTGTTRVCDVSPVWGFTPDATTAYSIRKILCTARATAQAQAGDDSTITLASTEPEALASKIVGQQIEIVAGTGIGQVRTVVSYVHSTKIAELSAVWTTEPDNTSIYIIKYRLVLKADYAAVAGGGDDELVFPATASETDDFYNGLVAVILEGTGAGEELAITDYDGATQTATMADDWSANPDATSVFALVRNTSVGMPFSLERKGVITGSNTVLAEADSGIADLEEETSSITPIGLTAVDIRMGRSLDEEGGAQVLVTGIAGMTIHWDAEIETQWVDVSA